MCLVFLQSHNPILLLHFLEGHLWPSFHDRVWSFSSLPVPLLLGDALALYCGAHSFVLLVLQHTLDCSASETQHLVVLPGITNVSAIRVTLSLLGGARDQLSG